MYREEFIAHGASVTCLALGPKSARTIVTGGEDKKIHLWAIGKTNCLMSLSGHTTTVECVKFGHNEDMVCGGSSAGALKVWDLEAAKLLRTLTGHKSNIRCLDFHPYGDFVASGSLDTNIKLWDIRKKGCMYTYKGHSKDIYCVKFSPDGRWLASGGDEGSVKLWDLPAGKMLAELKEHTGGVTDVSFHPNEFLLASASTDGTVKFWDLETFQQVSTTVNEAGPIKKIIFHSDGKAILSGARDVLKVYGWEPSRTFDTIMMGWGKVNDIAVSDHQLVAGTYSLTNVSVFVADLKKVQPFGQPGQTKILSPRDSVSRQSTRRNFVTGHCSTTHLQLESLESNKSEECETGTSDEAGDECSLAEIKNVGDYKEIFQPRQELCRTPPKYDPFALSNSLDFPSKNSEPNLVANFSQSMSSLSFPNTILSKSRTSSGMRSVESLSTNILPLDLPITPPIHLPAVTAPLLMKPNNRPVELPSIQPILSPRQPVSTTTITVSQSEKTIGYTAKISTSVLPQSTKTSTTKVTSLVHPRQPETISIVRPVMNERMNADSVKDNINIQNGHRTPVHSKQKPPTPNLSLTQMNNTRAAIVYPEQQKPRSKSPPSPDSYELIPESRDHPAGLDIDEFLPKHLQDTIRLGYHPQPEMSENEAMQAIVRGHKSVVTALSHRRKNIQIVLAMWSTKDSRNALEQAISMENQSVIVDVLNVIILKPAIWTLDMCQLLLPSIYDLLQSKYECYMSVGCAALKLVLKNFATIIKTNITAPPGIGVDISREERYNKCIGCYNQLLSVRAFILKRQTLQGKLGRSFRELSILMQNLE